MKSIRLEDKLNKQETINQYALINKDDILNANMLLINNDLHNRLLNKNNIFTFNLKFHTEEELLNIYGITFEDLAINRKMPQLYKLAYRVFINRDTRTLHNKECLKLAEVDNGYTVKDTAKTVKHIIDTDDLNTNNTKRLAKNYYYTSSNQYKKTEQIQCSAGILNISRDDKTKAGIKDISVISIEIDLHDIEDIDLLKQKKEELKSIIKSYDLPGTVCYTTNRSIYMQYTLSHPINELDYIMIKKVLAHRLYLHTGLMADLANMNPAIIHHVKLTLHDKNNMQSIVAPFLWYDLPYDTATLLKYCKWYIRNYKDEYNTYFKQTPNERILNYHYIQLQNNTLNFLFKDEEIFNNFNKDSLYKIIKNIKVEQVDNLTGEINYIYGFDMLFNRLNHIYIIDNIKQSYGQQISDINVINNFLITANIDIINQINSLAKTVKEVKDGNILNDKQLKQIINFKYNTNNERLNKIALWIHSQKALINQCREYYQISSVIIKYCQWFNEILDIVYKEIEANKIIFNEQQINNENDIDDIIVQEHIGFIPFEWKETKQVIRTKYISSTYIEQEKKYIANDYINTSVYDSNNEAKYAKMITNYVNEQGKLISSVLSEDVIPSFNFKRVFKATQKFKNDILTDKEINDMRQLFKINEEERNMSYTLTLRTILRELGNQLHVLCDEDLETLRNKKSIKHQFYAEHRASMMFNTEVECKFANCYIETFYSFNGKPSGSILDLITWCFASKDITYQEAKNYAIKFLARILNINIRSQKSVSYSHIHTSVINQVDKLVNKLTTLLNNSRSRTSNSQDLIKLANLIKNKLVENSYYDNNIKVLKKYNSLDKEKVFNTQAMITVKYLNDQFGWTKSKSSRLMNMLLDAGIFGQITNKNDIADKRLQSGLNSRHNLPFIITFIDFNETLKLKSNNKVISSYYLSKLKIEYIFNLERLTKIKYNNWNSTIKDKFHMLDFIIIPVNNLAKHSIENIYGNNTINTEKYNGLNILAEKDFDPDNFNSFINNFINNCIIALK